MRCEHAQSSITMQRNVVGKCQERRGKEQEVGRDMPTLSLELSPWGEGHLNAQNCDVAYESDCSMSCIATKDSSLGRNTYLKGDQMSLQIKAFPRGFQVTQCLQSTPLHNNLFLGNSSS